MFKRFFALCILLAGVALISSLEVYAAQQIGAGEIVQQSNNARVLAKDGLGNYYVAYSAAWGHVNVKKSDDNGQTWKFWNGTSFSTSGSETPIDGGSGSYPALAIDSNNNVYVIWQTNNGSNDQIQFTKYNPGSNTWTSPVDIYPESYNQNEPGIAISPNNTVHVVWHGSSASSPTRYQIRYSKYNGTSWTAPIDLTSENAGDQYYPSIDTDGSNNVHVVWWGPTDTSSGYDMIRYKKYTSSTNSWGSIVEVTNESNEQWFPELTADNSGNVHIAWLGRSNASPTNDQIRYAKYTVSTNSWSAPIDLTNESGGMDYPAISANSSNNIYVTWISNSGGWNEVKYMKYTTSWTPIINVTSGSPFHQSRPTIAKGLSVIAWKDHNGNIMFTSLINPVTTLAAPSVADTSDYGNASDIKVTFTAPTDESKIKEYRLFLVPSGTSFDESSATAIRDLTKYNLERKSRFSNIKKHIVKLKYNLKDINGNALDGNTDYYSYVLAVAKSGYDNSLSPVSAQSVRISTGSSPVDTVTGLSVTDIGSSNNASDLVIKFNKANETPIKEYKIFIVPQSQGALSLANAITLANTTLYFVKTVALNRLATKSYTIKLSSGQVDSTGAAVAGGTYNIYVLSIPKNTSVRYYSITAPVSVTIQ